MSDYKPIEKLDYTFYKWIHISKDLSDLCYVGSTANMVSRKAKHKCSCNNPNQEAYNRLLYKTMRENGGFNEFKMVILGTAEQITKREAQALEEQYRLAERATLNSISCFRTAEQYRQDTKQEKAEYDKQYRQDNKAETAERSKQYYQDHKEELTDRHKRYYEANKALIREQQKAYRQAKKALQAQAEETI